MSEITLQAIIADIESEQIVYPISVGENFNLVQTNFTFIDCFYLFTVINISDLLLISR